MEEAGRQFPDTLPERKRRTSLSKRKRIRGCCKKAPKKYLRRKKLRSVWYASVLLAVAVVFFAGTVKPDMEVYRKKERETYERLLEKASGMGLLQAQECYHKAAALSPQVNGGMYSFFHR